ncbi:MAG: hypothetical protein R3B70_38715 [Polyangiaceae bacterium]
MADVLMRRFVLSGVPLVMLACGPSEPPAPPAGSPAPSAVASAQAAVSASASSSASAVASAAAPEPPPPAVSFAEAADVVFPEGASAGAPDCKAPSGAARAEEEEAIKCLLRARFAKDAAARDLAVGMFDSVGTVTGVIREHTMDGGWRGDIHLVPELPVLHFRKHLGWVKQSFEDIDAFFAGLDAKRPAGTKSTYRYKALTFRFFRSVGRTTPSAYADGWEVSYNVSGSLHSGLDAVRETMFHEVFHSNDSAHGGWSSRALTTPVSGILDRCGQNTACLTPYAPGTTMVRGGTYYAFQKGNGVWEYAAELATRYFDEHRAILRGEKLKKAPFKCGPEENAKAWKALVDEFFGVDLTPECPAK